MYTCIDVCIYKHVYIPMVYVGIRGDADAAGLRHSMRVPLSVSL